MGVAQLHEVRSIIVNREVVYATLETLQEFGSAKLEGLVLWLGLIEPGRARVVRAFVPEQESVTSEDGLGYFVSSQTLFELNRGLAETSLRLIAQVHSHPSEAYHSEVDDRYAIVTAEGGLSLVVPDFGRASPDPSSWAVYRLTNGVWAELDSATRKALFKIAEEP